MPKKLPSSPASAKQKEDAMRKRDEIIKQRQVWLQQRSTAHTDTLKSKNQSRQQSGVPDHQHRSKDARDEGEASTMSSAARNRLTERLSDQLSSKLQLLSIPGDPQRCQLKSARLANAQMSELDMHMSCQVCYEVMLAPRRDPVVLFPCGHTFCKACTHHIQAKKNKCPYCRTIVQSHAINVPLQQMISRIADVGHGKHDSSHGSNDSQCFDGVASDASVLADKYLQEYRTAAMRCRSLKSERRKSIAQMGKFKDETLACMKVGRILDEEQKNAQRRLEKVQKELRLIQQHQEENEKKREEAQSAREDYQANIETLNKALVPLEEQKDKAKLLLQNFQPNISLSDDEDD